MAKPKPKPKTVEVQVIPTTGTFVSVFRSDHLLYEALQIDVKNGRVIDAKIISRAPDFAATAIGSASKALWKHHTTQNRKEVLPEEAAE